MNNPKDHRLGLRVLGYFILIFLSYWIINVILGVVPNWIMNQLGVTDNLRTYFGSTLTYGLRLTAVITLSAWALRQVTEDDPWRVMFPRCNGWKDLLLGLSLTAAVILAVSLIEISAGWLVVEGWSWQIAPAGVYWRSFWTAILINLVAAVGEEAMFRGYLLSGLKKAWGDAYGLLIMAAIFAAMHLVVQGAEETFFLLFVLLLSLPGVVLGWIFLKSKALWLPIGIHFAWNLLQDEVFNLPGRDSATLIGAMTQQNGPEWIVGTTYGVEVGLVGVLAMAIICLAALKRFSQ